jgi:hypothetical protein
MLMGDIYRGGCYNLIHLGDDDEPMLDRAIENILAIYEEIRADTNDFTEFESIVLQKTDSGSYWTRSQTPLKVELDVEALTKFFSKSWFRCVAMPYGIQTPSLIPSSL